jgi:endo-1,4-beta-xylanase
VFGASAAQSHMGESAYVTTLDREFNQLTPENEMKWDATEPNQGSFSYGAADQLVSHAQGQGMKIRGHTLVWHNQLPGWVSNITSGSALLSAMQNHIAHVAGHFTGKLAYWDVVNEAFNEDGSRRGSIFQTRIGNSYIEQAFRAARTADGAAKLCYNDYNTDGANAKSTAIYNMVADFKNRGVPIDCVGFQAHLNGSPPADMQSNLQRFANLGVDVHITELDIANAPANAYSAVVNACLAVSRCTVMTVWGVTDKYSWRSSTNPLLFDGNYNKKPAYDAVLAALGGTSGGGGTGGVSCSITRGQQWSDRFNSTVNITNSGTAAITSWTSVVTMGSGQKVSAVWNGSPTWDSSGNVMTVKPSGNGNLSPGQSTSFGFTTNVTNGNFSNPAFTCRTP